AVEINGELWNNIKNINGKWGFIDKFGKEVVPCIYDNVSDGPSKLKEGMAMVKLNDKWGFVDEFGEEVVHCLYEDVSDFNEGLARVKINGRYGFVNKRGKEIIPCVYYLIECFFENNCKKFFYENLAVVAKYRDGGRRNVYGGI